VIRTGGVGIGLPHDRIWLEALALRPDLVERYQDVHLEQSLQGIGPLVRAGYRHLFGGSDFASQEGPFFSPAMFERFFVPRLRTLSDACNRAGAKFLFASDGNLWPVADLLFRDAGIHGYYEIDRTAGMDLKQLRSTYPDMTLIGNIASQTLHLGSVEDVERETRDCLETAKEHGRIIVGVSNYPVPGTPIRNAERMLELIRELR